MVYRTILVPLDGSELCQFAGIGPAKAAELQEDVDRGARDSTIPTRDETGEIIQISPAPMVGPLGFEPRTNRL